MKKNFKWLLALVAMVASINLGWAAETVSWTAASGALGSTISSKGSSANGTIKTGDFEWNYTRTLKNLGSGKSDYIAMSGAYLQIGSSNAGEDVNFATSAFSGKTISSITIDCGSASHSLSVKVGGVACTISPALSSTKQEVVATPTSTSNTGNIDISFSVGTNKAALYVKSIKVVYNNGGTPSGPTLESIYFTDDAATKLSYTEGDVFDPAGLVVMGKYSEGEDKPVTDDVEWSFSPETLATTTTSVTVTAHIDDVEDAQKTVNGITVASAPKFTKVTASKTDWSGEYLLVYENNSTAYVWTGVDAANCNATATISNNQITKPADAVSLTIAAMDGGYSILVNGGTNDGKYIYGTSSKNQINFGTTASANTITYPYADDNNSVKIVSNSATMRYNNASGNNRFRYFGSAGQQNIQLYEKVLAPTNEAVTFAAPTDGTLVIKNGATPISSGAIIQNGTVLDVEFEMTPAEAYKNVAIKVTNASTSEDVTTAVYDAETKKITMPRYAITVAVTFTKLYKISLATDGEGTGTATMNDVTTDIYVDGETQINLLASAVAPNEFTKWSATDNIAIDKENEAETYAFASGDGTITATFGVSALLPLDAPTLSAPTNITYNSVTLNWQELAHAEAYNVELLLNDETVASDVISETSWTPEATLQANTTYTYTVQGVGDGTTYAEENNPKAQSTVKTADYPAVVLTLSENSEETPVEGKLNTAITLPPESTQACDGKVFVGWSENPIEGEVGKDQVNLLGETYTFTDPAVLEKTIYAVYAKEEKGTTTWNIATSIVAGEVIVFSTNTSSDYRYTAQTIASNIMPCAASTYSDDKSQITTLGEGTQQYTVGGNSENGFTFATAGGYLYISADKKVDVKNTATTWTCSINGTTKVATISQEYSSNNYSLKFNPNIQSGVPSNPRFTVYKSGQQDIVLYKKTTSASTYSNYCTTCQAAVAAPTFGLAEGNYGEAQTLELTATEGDIYYTINDGEETKYTAAIALNNRGTFEISAYAKVNDRTSETVTKTYTLDWAYTLTELVAEGAPTTTGRTVTVILTNEVIESIVTSGSYVNGFFTMVGDKKIEVYCKNSPSDWEVGGKVSGTVTCPWKDFQGTWELCPTDWNWASYTAPAKIESLKITGDVDNKNYTAGQKLDFTGLTVTGVYSDATEEAVTEDVVWTEVTLTENQPEATATATLNNAKTGNLPVVQSKTITGLTVGAKVELSKIEITTEASKKDFFVGRNFNHDGIEVTATYTNATTSNVTNACQFSTPTLANKGQETITITYSEGEGQDKKEVTTSYTINVKYMNLEDLVAEDIPTNTSVKVAFSDVEITGFYTNKNEQRTGVYVNVKGKNDKNIELYYNTPSTDLDAWQEGGLLATKNAYISGTWSYYENGEVWEITFASGWDWDTNLDYTAPNIPVTSMEIAPAAVSVKEGATTTLSIVYDPTNATNTGVTWAVTAGSDNASVDADGVVTGIKAGTATITATLTADPTITATRTVTVTETPKCTISYYVKDKVASTQEIAREEEGTLTYEPTLVVAGYTFAGWAEEAITEESATATLISTYTPGAEETAKSVYAVFKRVDDSSPTYQQYAKVTSALTNWAGDYLIAYSDKIFANGQKGGTDNGAIGKQYVNVNPEGALSGNVVTKEWGDQYKVTLEEISAGSNTYVLKTQDGKYNYQTSNANGLSATTTKSTAAAYPISVTFTSENDVKLALGGSATGAVFRYNTDQFFRYYKDGGQKAVYLYKYDAGTALYTSNPVAKVKVTFNLDGGVGGCGTITVNQGEDVTLCGDAPTKDLNKFKAWSAGVNEYAADATIENVMEDIELKALWIAKKQYTITFSKGGAAGTTPDDITDYEYNEVTLPAQGDLSNAGYIFGGWNDGETTYAGGATFTMPEKNVSMTAVWVAKTNDKWVLVTSVEQLKTGEKYVIANNENDAVAGDITGSYMTKVNATFSDNKQFITGMTGQVELTLGGSTDAWTFAKDASNYLANSGTSLSWSTTASTWKIAFEDDEMTIVEGTNNSLQYNTGSPRFKTYTSSQATVQLYVLVPAQEIAEEKNISDINEHADITVVDGGKLIVNENKTLGDLYVMAGGKVTIQEGKTLAVKNFVIKSEMGGGKSGQVIGVTENYFKINGDAFFDVTMDKCAEGSTIADQWHAFAVPFNVDAINGIYDLDDKKLTNEVNYAIMDYHGDVRAEGKYGWKKFRGIMTPGTFYLMTVDGERTTYRMKMASTFEVASKEIDVYEFAQISGETTDAGWNGIANSQLEYVMVAAPVQVLNPATYTYEPYAESSVNFTVGTPFFYQASATGTIDLTAPNAGANYAPRMTAEAKNIAVTFANESYTDRLYISATDEATDEYQIGRDLVKMTMTNTPAVPQIFAQAYGTKLCMIDAPMAYDQASYALSLYAPAAGTYTISAAQVEGYEIYLTQNGNAIWNLSMSEATVELTKGDNTEYGLILKRAAYAPTNMENLKGMNNVQKLFFNDNIYIIRDAKVFNAQGVKVK